MPLPQLVVLGLPMDEPALEIHIGTSEERRTARLIADIAKADRSYTIVGDVPTE